MALPISVSYEALQQAVKTSIIDTYQHGSLLGLFPSEPIPKGLSAEEWGQRYIKESKRAAIHPRGFKPNRVTMDFSGFSIKPVTVDQDALLTEIDLAQFAENGMLPKFVPEMGKNMSYTSNRYIMANLSGNDNTVGPYDQYHYILEAGTGNGTAARPIPMYDVSGGAWNTHATMRADIGAWLGTYGAKGGNLANSIVLAPKATMPTLRTAKSEYNDHSVEDYIALGGISKDRILYVDDEFMPTIDAGTALPTKDLFDLIVLDPSQFGVGYQRTERVRAGMGAFPDRNYYIEAEVWFAFVCVPFRKNEAGTVKTYKHMARCKDISTS